MARSVNAETLEHVKRWEGFRADAYPDPGSRDGKPVTIGYGQTRRNGRPIQMGEKITEPEAALWLQQELARISAVVERLVKVPLTDNQFGALVSFTYNVGDSAFETSTLLKKLNAGDYEAVPIQMARWVNNDGKKMQGLVSRRAAEAGLWAKGSFVSSAPVDAKPGNPLKELVTPENMAAGGGLLGGGRQRQWPCPVCCCSADGHCGPDDCLPRHSEGNAMIDWVISLVPWWAWLIAALVAVASLWRLLAGRAPWLRRSALSAP